MSEATSKYAVLVYDTQNKWIYLCYLGFVPRTEHRLINQELLELVTAKKATKMLGDLTRMGAIAPDDQKWMIEFWAEQTAKVAPLSIALILPKQAIASMSLKSFDKLATPDPISPSNTRHFSSDAEASAWLKTVN